MRVYQRLLVVLGTVVLLAGCASSVERVPQEVSAFPDAVVPLSELGDEFLRHGEFRSPSSISQVDSGASQADTQRFLGQPVVTREGEDGQQWWFYNINFLLAEDKDDLLICQYRVAFDGQQEVAHTTWRRPQCRSFYAQALDVAQISLSAKVLFVYDSAELTPSGRQKLDEVADMLTTDFDDPYIQITGHADRIASVDYNLELSERRAEAVSTYLASRNIPSDRMSVAGKGFHEPVVFCEGDEVTEELKRCLQPNRRVEITITDDQDN